MSLTTCLIVMLGGAFGTLARYLIGLMALPISQDLPWGTIIINIAGSFIMGFFGTMTVAHGRFPAPETARLFVMVGICGGFTTFSSFSLQTLDLAREGRWDHAIANIGASVTLCLIAVTAGYGAAMWINASRGA